ncbi:YaeQ family protein [Saccharophagus degradans]|uniref:YaeQ family protein n=1 Tax=Saccharophagus degradans TaxID=86304 RepID=UPI002477D179|nr:YaeQ family protein [Saccharophagus degradans]WGO97004.1 YaeQ family protein [Saccharophagus degradans]
MALNATIYKFALSISDLNRDFYDSMQLTVAQHPSENAERMMVRVLAYCLEACEGLAFTKGLSTPETPDLWAKSLDDQINLWVEVGEPAADKIKKATRLAKEVKVYSFNSKSDVWWSQEQKKLEALDVSVVQFPWDQIQSVTKLLARTMTMSVTITGDSIFVNADNGDAEVHWQRLQTKE